MKKILLCSVVLSGILFANQLSYLPLNKSNLSNENGGEKTAIEAYSDGIGIYTVGKFQIDNSPMNELVFIHGEEARKAGETLKEFVIETGNNKEKLLAEKLGNLAENIIPDDGTSCDDNNDKTINDIYLNGICLGTDVSNYYFLSPNGIKNNECSYENPCSKLSDIPSSDAKVVLKNGTYNKLYVRQASWHLALEVLHRTEDLKNKYFIIGESKNGVILDYDGTKNTTERDRNIIYTNNMTLANLTLNYKSGSNNTYSSSFVNHALSAAFHNVNMNITGVYSLNYNNYSCSELARVNYSNVNFNGGTKLVNWSCFEAIYQKSIFEDSGIFSTY
jgi:hypothetical protein